MCIWQNNQKRVNGRLLVCLLVLLLGTGTFVSAQAPASSFPVLVEKITIGYSSATADRLLKDLDHQSTYDFIFDEQEFRKVQLTGLPAGTTSLGALLTWLQRETGLAFAVNNTTIAAQKRATPAAVKKPVQPGKLAGIIVDEENGQPVMGATIRIGDEITTSGIDGAFSIALPKGSYTAQVSLVGYGARQVTEIDIKSQQTFELNITLKRVKGQLAEVVVIASAKRESINALYARQKNNAAVSDGITAEQISRTPDNNTAQVLKRISGLQVSDNKYVVVRGLSDRYNNVLLNGAMLPSSEPNKRNFAFDMIPSAILDRIIVNKTATPDLTGEFTGGLVQIETKDIPVENFFQISAGTGFNTQSTGKEMMGLDRGENAWIGFASDVHKKPVGMSFGEYSVLESKVSRTEPATSPVRQQMHQFLSTMPVNWAIKKYNAQPTQNYQLQAGRVVPFKNESQLGVVAALTYRNEQDIEKRSLYAVYGDDFSGTNNKYATTLGGSLNLGYRFGKHKLTLQNTYNRKFSDNMWKYTGVDGDNNNIQHDSYANVTIINQLFQSQLGGEHSLGKRHVKLDWFVAAGRTDRDQPYSRQMARLNGTKEDNYPKDYFSYDVSDNRLKDGNLFSSELHEKIYNWAANVQIPFQLLHQNQSFKAGYQGKYRSADFGASLFRIYSFDASSNAGKPFSQVFSAENFGSQLYLHPVNGQGMERESAESSEGYDGFQRLNSFYAMLDLKPFKKLRLIGGMRAEKNDQNVNDYVWNPQTRIAERQLVTNKQTDWLPSVNAIYSITDKLNLRAAWYKTVARPDFRELSSFAYWDYDFFATVQGTPLKTTNIQNADLRLEYYPAPGEVISVSGFYKDFKNPIELMYLFSSASRTYLYKNLEGAKDKGFEVDFRKSMDFISPSSSILSKLYLSGNFTWLAASVNFYADDAVDGAGNRVSVKRDRPLAGQSPYIVNGGLMYAGNSFGMNISYNRSGKRIVFASPDRSDDEYENPRDLLDLQVSYKFLKKKNLEIKFNVNDLLNQEQLFYKNTFDLDNPFGFTAPWPSIERYPGVGAGMLPEHIDPKGTSYSKAYDTVVRRFRFGTSFTLNFIYRF